MKLFKKITQLFRSIKEINKTPLDIEIERTKSAIKRYEYQLSYLMDDPDEDNWILGSYDLKEKLKRVHTQLYQLEIKRWKKYLSSIIGIDGDLARELWKLLTDIYSDLPSPQACSRSAYLDNPTPADGGYWFGWDKGPHHLEIEILPDHSLEWFYRNRQMETIDSGEALSDSVKRYLLYIMH